MSEKHPMKIKRITGIRVECEAPSHVGIWAHLSGTPYGTAGYWDKMKRDHEEWANEFRAFLRDHRSQDMISLSIVRDESDGCTACGSDWEEDGDGCPCCCMKAVEAWYVMHPDKRPIPETEQGATP